MAGAEGELDQGLGVGRWRGETEEGDTRELESALLLLFTVSLNLLSPVDPLLSNTVNQL